ncbi:MAG: ATP-dependent DNA ligase [Candidatus Bathyarchaeia archaeon]
MKGSFIRLCEVYESIEKLSSRSEIVELMAGYFKDLNASEVKIAVKLSTSDFREALNVSWATLLKTLKELYRFNDEDFYRAFNDTGDVGSAVKSILEAKRLSRQTLLMVKPLTLEELDMLLREVSEIKGPGSKYKKVRVLKGLFSKVSPLEAKYLVRIILGDLRIGVKEGIIVKALSEAFHIPYDALERALMLSGDLAMTAAVAKTQGLHGILNMRYVPFNPIKPMLAGMAYNVREILDEFKGKAAFEYKLDGARVQIHAFNGGVRVFSRGLKDVTSSLPEVVDAIRGEDKLKNCVVEGEVIAVNFNGKPLPFQELMHRFKRIRSVEEEAKRLPIKLYLFDILVDEGSLTIGEPYIERRKRLTRKVESIPLVDSLMTQDLEEAEEFYRKALEYGHEGVVAKKPDSIYHPGVRGRDWLKVKETLDTLDLVIVGGEYGYGRRYRWISDYFLAALDNSTGGFTIIGKTFKGLVDEEFENLTKTLENDVVKREGRRVWVNPRIVVEVAYNEIQKSQKYPSGFALRFARIVRIRWDKKVEEADTIDKVREIYIKQFERKASNYQR